MIIRSLITAVCAVFLLNGCLVAKSVGAPTTGSKRSSLESGASQCKPSQYWDGEKCRHKGKGKGARKHDD